MPKVSIIAPSYNHEKYIKMAIESVLNQTFKDFELVITDDGSTDNTVEVIKQFNDPRIKLFIHEKNKGAILASYNSFINSTGEYVAFLTTDDIYEINKLEKQVKFLDENPDIASVFSWASIINEEGATVGDSPFEELFKQANRSRQEWLNYFFFTGNCLCAPTQMIKRDVFNDIDGYFKNNYKQLNDFECHIRLCLSKEIHIIQEPLLKLRIRDNEKNASALTKESLRRICFETKQFLENFKNIKSTEEFLKIFPESEKYIKTCHCEESKSSTWQSKKIYNNDLIPYYLAKLILDNEFQFDFVYKEFALEILFELLENREKAEKLSKDYGFSAPDLYLLTGEINSYYDYILSKNKLPDKNQVKNMYSTSEIIKMLVTKVKKNIQREVIKYSKLEIKND